jgi:hypothetical protein
MKCLVYGIYILEVVQSALVTEMGFRTFVTMNLGDVQIFNRIDTVWLSVPILTAIGELSRTEHERLTPNILPRYILRSGILCASDQIFGTIEKSGGSNHYCKFLKRGLYI